MKIVEVRSRWIRQLIRWTDTGCIGETKYTQEQMHKLISTDSQASKVIPDYLWILELFSTSATKSKIKAQLHEILKKVQI